MAGNGGHGIAKLRGTKGIPLRAPATIQSDPSDTVVLENYDDQDYGYLRIIADAGTLRIEYHPATDGGAAKTPDDVVIVDLATPAIR